ncbi:hypothetical protein LIER_16885 [Lithospermum erythrorhizon]|uniref:Uncharacterized protein n=1 Tax=Lithospermum erythrorhizon TaxID=34254 RepID=A0AAV3QDQ5_LITER
MKTEEKQKKFHDALLNMLYPPPPSSHKKEPTQNHIDLSNSAINANELEDEEKSSSSDDDEGDKECGMEKMTRSQRKRVRKKKLKEAKSQRRKIIGPLMRSGHDDNGVEHNEEVDIRSLQGVRRFASEKKSCTTGEVSEVVFDSKRSKQKQRRMGKKMACVQVEKKHHGQETDYDKEEEIIEEEKQGIE